MVLYELTKHEGPEHESKKHVNPEHEGPEDEGKKYVNS